MGILDKVNAVIAGVKKVREVAQKLHDAELQSAIADLLLNVADLKTEMADLREQNLHLRGEIEELRKKADVRAKVAYRDGLYYLSEPVQGYPDGPFCPVCVDDRGVLITLKRTFVLNPGLRTKSPRGWRCGCCKNRFQE
jgi:hypothetical protein